MPPGNIPQPGAAGNWRAQQLPSTPRPGAPPVPGGGFPTNGPQPGNTQGLPTVRLGSQGLSVAYCQNLLNCRLPHCTALWVDGIFGANTHGRVQAFQSSRGLVADGIVGPATWAALEAGPPAIRKRPQAQAQAQTEQEPVVPATGGF